jgi:hypothetical protein
MPSSGDSGVPRARRPVGRGLLEEGAVAPRDHRVELRVHRLQPREAGRAHVERREAASR